MAVQHLHSITEIKKEHCYETRGSRPVRVFCSDLNYYVCKYHTGQGFSFTLFNEYIAARFLQIWQLPVPEFAFIEINQEHLKQTPFPNNFFEKPCFGSLFMGDFKEVDKIFLETPLVKKENLTGRDSFLKIALFDIWMCNEDRHYDNFNLLYNLKENVFVPIDHVYCFNTVNLDKEPYLISENESILSTPFINRFFDRDLQTKMNEIRLRMVDELKINAKNCYDELDSILSEIPLSWQPSPVYLKSRLQFLFSEQWLKSCIDYFTRLFFLNFKSK
jgi:hypothetical protein